MLLFYEIATLPTVARNDDLVSTRAMPACNDAENYQNFKMFKNKTHKNSFSLLLPYLWSKDFDIRLRIVTSLICLVIAKVINIFVPIVYKYIINGLNKNFALSVMIGIIVAYGGTKILVQQ